MELCWVGFSLGRTFTPCTTTRFSDRMTWMTSPVEPLSLPAITITWSPRLTCVDDLLSEGDLHEAIAPRERRRRRCSAFGLPSPSTMTSALRSKQRRIRRGGGVLHADDDALHDGAGLDLQPGMAFFTEATTMPRPA